MERKGLRFLSVSVVEKKKRYNLKDLRFILCKYTPRNRIDAFLLVPYNKLTKGLELYSVYILKETFNCHVMCALICHILDP
jgi:hypothetical protein